VKIYLMSSPRNIDTDKQSFSHIYNLIEDLGHSNLTDFVLKVDAADFYKSDITKFYDQTVKYLKQADICIFETSIPSLAIGHLIALALQYGKPVIALYKGKNLPFFLSGINDEKIQIINYDESNLKRNIEEAIEFAKDRADTRFNFFISPSLSHYLDWVASTKKIPRSVYLRQLIEEDRDKNSEEYGKS